MPPVRSLHNQSKVAPVESQGNGTVAVAESNDVLAQFMEPQHSHVEPANAPSYVGFITERSNVYGTIKSLFPDVTLTDAFCCSDNTYHILRPLRFFLVEYEQFYSEMDDANNVVRTCKSDPQDQNSLLKDDILTCILVIHDNKLIPCRTNFRVGRAPAAHTAAAGYKIVSDPAGLADWVRKSPAHEVSARIPFPFARFVTTVSVSLATSRKGRKYQKAVGAVRPPTVEEIDLFSKSASDETWKKRFRAALAAHRDRVAEYRAKSID